MDVSFVELGSMLASWTASDSTPKKSCAIVLKDSMRFMTLVEVTKYFLVPLVTSTGSGCD